MGRTDGLYFMFHILYMNWYFSILGRRHFLYLHKGWSLQPHIILGKWNRQLWNRYLTNNADTVCIPDCIPTMFCAYKEIRKMCLNPNLVFFWTGINVVWNAILRKNMNLIIIINANMLNVWLYGSASQIQRGEIK